LVKIQRNSNSDQQEIKCEGKGALQQQQQRTIIEVTLPGKRKRFLRRSGANEQKQNKNKETATSEGIKE
jgi:hypothetical protein